MTLISETGHVININNAKVLIDTCGSLGSAFNPSNADISILGLTSKWTLTDASHQAFTLGFNEAKNPINARQILYKPANKLVTRVMGYLKSTKASPEFVKNAKSLSDRFRGFGTNVMRLKDGSPDPQYISISHQSYVQKGDAFKQLVDLLNTEVNYDPNEDDLKIDALKTLSDDMKAANDGIGSILSGVNILRVARDKNLYEHENGLVDRSLACKEYVKGVFGATSAEFKLVNRIRFKNLKKL